MDPFGVLLAEIPDFGRVYDCGSCGNLHITVGPVTLTLMPEAYQQFVLLMHASAVSYETGIQQENGSVPDCPSRKMTGDCGFTGS